MAAGTEAASGHNSRGSSAALQSSLDRRFRGVTNTMESIQKLSTWCIENKKYHNLIVRYWMKWLKKSGASHRLNLFYLANDVIQNCKRKNAIVYRTSFSEVLPEATLLVKDAKVRKSVERILNIWEERSVYPEEMISELRAGLSRKAPSTGGSSTTPVNPKVAMKSKIVAEFVPQAFIEQLTVHKHSVEEAELKEKQLAALRVDVCSTEALKRLKDKAGGKKFSQDFEEGSTKLQDFVSFLDKQVKRGPPLLETLNNADVFYEMQYKEVKIIANAYKTFANRVMHLKRKLDTLKSGLPGLEDSPVPSPSEDAPSPTGSESPFHDMEPGSTSIDGDEVGLTLGDAPSPLSSPGASPLQSIQHGEKDNRDVEDMELSEGEETESLSIIVEERVEKPVPVAVPSPITVNSQPLLAQEGNPVKQTPPPATPATPATPLLNLANVDLGKISSILSSLTSVMKSTGVSPVSRTSPGTPSTPSSQSSALKTPTTTPGGLPLAPNPLASILSRVDISPQGLLSALSKTQSPSAGLQGASHLQSVPSAASGGHNPSSTVPLCGPSSNPTETTPTLSPAPTQSPVPTPAPALNHKPLPGSGAYKQEMERKAGQEPEKGRESTPPVSSSPSSLESKINKFLQGNPGIRAFNLSDGQGSCSNSPLLAAENLDGTPVRDEAPGTPTQDEIMDQPGTEPFMTTGCGPTGVPLGPPSHNDGIRAGPNADDKSLGRAENQEFGRNKGYLSPTAYHGNSWEAPNSSQAQYGDGPAHSRDYRPLRHTDPTPSPRDAIQDRYCAGPGNPSHHLGDFYDSMREGAGEGERRGPTAGEHYPLHPLSATEHLKFAAGDHHLPEGMDQAPGGPPPSAMKHEAPHYRHIETLVSMSASGEGAPIEILGYNGSRRSSGERIQTVESIRVIERGMRPHPPRGGETGLGPGRGGWHGDARNPGLPPHRRADDASPRPPNPHQPFQFEERGHSMPYHGRDPSSLPPPNHQIPPSSFFSSPPPPIPPPPPPPIPKLPPPPQDFLSPPSSVMVGGVLVPVDRALSQPPSRVEGEERAGPVNHSTRSAGPSSLLGESPLFKELPHHGVAKEHFPSRQGPLLHRPGPSMGRPLESPSPPASPPLDPSLQHLQGRSTPPQAHGSHRPPPSSPRSAQLHVRPPHHQPHPHLPPHLQRPVLHGHHPRPLHPQPPHFDREPPHHGGKRPSLPFAGPPRGMFRGGPFYPPKRPFLPPRY